MGAALSFSRDEVSRLEAELRAAHAARTAEAEQAVQVPVLEEHVASLEASLVAEQQLRQRSAQANREEIIKVRPPLGHGTVMVLSFPETDSV